MICKTRLWVSSITPRQVCHANTSSGCAKSLLEARRSLMGLLPAYSSWDGFSLLQPSLQRWSRDHLKKGQAAGRCSSSPGSQRLQVTRVRGSSVLKTELMIKNLFQQMQLPGNTSCFSKVPRQSNLSLLQAISLVQCELIFERGK